MDDDSQLPYAHRALIKCKESHREATIIKGALLTERAHILLPVTKGNAPIVTKTLLALLRHHRVYSTGLTFGEGFSAFKTLCQGHPNAKEAKQKLEDQGLLEQGASMCMANACALSHVCPVSSSTAPRS